MFSYLQIHVLVVHSSRTGFKAAGNNTDKLINSTYRVDAIVLVQMSTESAQTTCMHCYKFQHLQTPCTVLVLVGKLTPVAALALMINLEDLHDIHVALHMNNLGMHQNYYGWLG